MILILPGHGSRAPTMPFSPALCLLQRESASISRSTTSGETGHDFTPCRARNGSNRLFLTVGVAAAGCGAGLSDTTGALHRGLSAGRRDRHPGPPDRAAAVGEARSAICRREQA